MSALERKEFQDLQDRQETLEQRANKDLLDLLEKLGQKVKRGQLDLLDLPDLVVAVDRAMVLLLITPPESC